MPLLENPFYILKATFRDNRQRLVELADERSLVTDSNTCMKARSDLTNPRKRLASEIGWLLGCSRKRADETIKLLESDPRALLADARLNISTIASANLLADALALANDCTTKEVIDAILFLACSFEELEPEELLALINEERVVSGFPEVKDVSLIENEIQGRRIHYRQSIKAALDRMSYKNRVESITHLIEATTDCGEGHGYVLIYDLIDSYEVEVEETLQKEEVNISEFVEKIIASVDNGQPDLTVGAMVDELCIVVKNWDLIAQPIQVSTKSKGLNHEASQRMAGIIRSLALHFYNKHGKTDYSLQITKMLQEVFAEVVEVAELVDSDKETLSEIAQEERFNALLEPIFNLCQNALENSAKIPTQGTREADLLIKRSGDLIESLIANSTSKELLDKGKDIIAFTIMNCAIKYGNETENWPDCVSWLLKAGEYATSKETRDRIDSNLAIVRENSAFQSASSHQKYRDAAGCFFVVFIWFFFGYLVSEPSPRNPGSTSVKQSSPMSGEKTWKSSSRNKLSQKIEQNKMHANILEKNIKDLDEQIEGYQQKMDNYRNMDMIDEYNQLVPIFNERVQERNRVYNNYDALIGAINDDVRIYNSGSR